MTQIDFSAATWRHDLKDHIDDLVGQLVLGWIALHSDAIEQGLRQLDELDSHRET